MRLHPQRFIIFDFFQISHMVYEGGARRVHLPNIYIFISQLREQKRQLSQCSDSQNLEIKAFQRCDA